MRALLVEDDPTAAQAVEQMLKSKGYACETTAYGEQAVELAARNNYDLILLDIMLPDIDGYEVLRRLRAKQVRTPVLIQTGLFGREELEKGVGIGTNHYVVKPFTGSELANRIEAVFARNDDDDPAPREEHGDNDDRRGQARDDEGIRRQHERMRTLKSGKIIYNNSNCVADCLILNLSDGGAALLTADFFDVPTDLVLKLGHGKTYDCEVCWQHGKKLGVRFV